MAVKGGRARTASQFDAGNQEGNQGALRSYVITGGNSWARTKAFNELPRGRAGGEVGPNGETGKGRFRSNKVNPDELRVRFEPKGQ